MGTKTGASGASGAYRHGELTAFRAAVGLAFLAAISYAVARLSVPLAGLAVGLGLLVLVPVAGAQRFIVGFARRPGGMRSRRVAAVGVALLLGALALVAAITVSLDPPLPALAWVGFGIAALVVLSLALGMIALLASGPAELAEEPPAYRHTAARGRRVLVVADGRFSPAAMRTLAARNGSAPVIVHVVAPVLASELHHWTSDDDGAREDARVRLDDALSELGRLGVSAEGEIGADDPLQAIDDALRVFPADEIVLVERDPAVWLEDGFPERARSVFGLPITEIAGPA